MRGSGGSEIGESAQNRQILDCSPMGKVLAKISVLTSNPSLIAAAFHIYTGFHIHLR